MSNVLNQLQTDSINSNLLSYNHSEKFSNLDSYESASSTTNLNVQSPNVSPSEKFKMTKEIVELNKIKSEILTVENSIRDLKLLRKLKLIKVNILFK